MIPRIIKKQAPIPPPSYLSYQRTHARLSQAFHIDALRCSYFLEPIAASAQLVRCVPRRRSHPGMLCYTLRVQTDHEILQQVRHLQTTLEWKARYERRAGIEGTISQGVCGFGLASMC